MQCFIDTQARTWVVELNVTLVGRVRKLLGIDLYRIGDDRFKKLDEILGDPCQLVDLLYVICKDQADTHQISDEDFGRAFAGDVLESAERAFVEALVDFFPNPKSREALRALVEKGRQVQEKAIELVTAKMATIDPAMEAKTLVESLTSSPELSESTPAP
jgi:hypothetical protein